MTHLLKSIGINTFFTIPLTAMVLASQPSFGLPKVIDFRRPLEKDGFWAAVYYIDGFWTAY